MSKLTEIKKDVGWSPPDPPLKYPRDDELQTLIAYADKGNESAYAQLLRYKRFLFAAKTAKQQAMLRKIELAMRDTRHHFEND